MIAPNKLKEALQEIKDYDLDAKVIDAMKQIKEAEKGHYYCLCISSKPSADGMTMLLKAKPVFANYRSWDKMKRQVEDGLFPGMFGGQFKKVVIFNDPTFVPKKKATPKKVATPKVETAEQ